MKKISLYLTLLASVIAIASCTEDYNEDVAAPQAWEQEEIANMPSLTLIAAADINLETATSETIQLVTYQLGEIPEGGSLDGVVIEVAKAKGETQSVMAHDNGKVSVDELQSLIESYYGKAAEMRSISVSAYAILDFEGQLSKVTALETSANVMPKTPIIIPEYYIVGGVQGWAIDSKSLAFYPVDAEVATLSLTTNFSGYPDGSTGTPNFKIFSAENMGDWANSCYGAATDGDTSLSGTLVENGGAIQCPSNDIYTLNIDMLNNTYSMEVAEDQDPVSYTVIGLIGGFNSWGADAELTESAPHNWYIEGFVHETAGELKFRADNDWVTSWGESIDVADINYGTTVINGANINLPAGTFDIFFNDITGQVFFVEK